MKDSTVIQNFQRIDRQLKEIINKQNGGFQQSFQYLAGATITLDALIQVLIERSIFTGDELRGLIQAETNRRQQQAAANKVGGSNEKQMESQPVIETDATGPTVEGLDEPSSAA